MQTVLRAVLPQDIAWHAPAAMPAPVCDQAYAAIAALTGADSVHVLSLDRLGGAISAIGGDERAGAPVAPRWVIAALADDSEQGWARASATWLADPAGQGTTVLLRVAERDQRVLVVVLVFRESAATCQARLAPLIKPAATLVRLWFQSESERTELERQKAIAQTALDDASYGVIAVQPDHMPILMNRAAQAMLTDGGTIQLSRGLLRPTYHRDAVQFYVALDTVVEGAARGGERPDAIMMLLSEKGSRLVGEMTVAVIAPVQFSLDHAAPGAAALVYLFRPEVLDTRGQEALCELLGLSRAETRLVLHLLLGRTLAEAAAGMRVKLETARGYLKQVFSKTGLHRQTDLVALLQRAQVTVRSRSGLNAA